MQSVTIDGNQAGQRLDKFLRRYLPSAGTGFLYKMLRKKNITLNGKKAEGSELLRQGDEVRFFFSEETFQKFAGQNGGACEGGTRRAAGAEEYRRAYRELAGIGVVYEDAHVLILDKPAGILTQKAAREDLSLNEWLIGYLLDGAPDLADGLKSFRPSVCNRLDRNTSGLVLCGKTLPGLRFLSQCIRERSVRKFYRTICVGALSQPALVKGYLKKDSAANTVQVCENGEGDYIETAYRPLCTAGNYTLLEVELITGKPHQIRAHLASAGYPLIGDRKYGDRAANRQIKERYGLEHQLLRACRVEFPKTQDAAGAALGGQSIQAPPSEQFERIQKGLGLS